MHKKIFCLALLSTFIFQTSEIRGADVAYQYLTSIGSLPTRDRDSCNTVCNKITCASDLSDKQYRCFKECSHWYKVTDIRECATSQFRSFIGGEINRLQQLNDLQGKQINELERELKNAQQKFKESQDEINRATDNNPQLREQLVALEKELKDERDRLNQLREANDLLVKQLKLAEGNIGQQDIRIDELNNQAAANQRELDDAFVALQALKEQLNLKDEQISGLKEEKSQLEKTVLEAERKLEDQAAQLTKIGLEKSKLESDIEALQESHDKRQIQNEIDKKAIAQLEAERLTLETVNKSLSGENQKAREQLEQAIANKDIEIKNFQSRLINNNLIVQQNQQSERAYEEKLKLMNAAYEAKNREAEKSAADLRQLQEGVRIEREQIENAKVDSVKKEEDVTKLKSTLMFSILANAGALKEVEQLKEENRQLRLEKLKLEMSIFEELKQKYKNLATKYQAYLGKKSHVFTLQEILTFIDKDAKERIFIGNMEFNFKMKELKKRIDQLKKTYQEYKNKNEVTSPEGYGEKRSNFPMKSREFPKTIPTKKGSSPAFGPSVNFEGSGQTVSPHSNFDDKTDYSHFDRPYSDESQDPYGRTNQ